MNLKVATSIDEYIDIVNELNKNTSHIWYRGMSKASYALEPSLFREKRIIGLKYSGREINGRYYRKSDAIMKSDLYAIDEFVKQYNLHYPEKCKNYNLIDYLYIMQHYDIPTRLLDFSTNHLAALYFSVSKSINTTKDLKHSIDDFMDNNGFCETGSSVHCIDPNYTNNLTYGNKKVKNINIDDIYKLDLPLCIETDNPDARIRAQNGVFIVFGRDYKGYDEYEVLSKNTTKIFIPNECRNQIKVELKKKFNISHTTIYPDMKGISIEIIEHIEEKYKRDCNSIFKN